jgi:hypothetical protein
MVDAPNPESGEQGKPPKGNWEAKPKSKPHWVEVATLIILAVVGFFQICIYFKQASIMQSQADIATAANKQSAAINAAFVYAKTINFAGPNTKITAGNDWVTGIQWENSGNTPTRDLLVAITYTGFPQPQKLPIFPNFKDIEKSEAFLGPKATTYLSLPIAWVVLSEVQAHQLYVYIFGRATYRDPISPENERVTRVCWELSYVPTEASQQFTGATYLPRCAVHNCADEECAREDREHPEAAPK